MGRSRRCSKEGLNIGAWTELEDKILIDWMKIHGEGRWTQLPKKAGLKRCGKSCRLRWLNYLRPGIKRGNISHEEDDLIIRLHKLLGNRWSLTAGRLPGRTDNEIKNHWNTNLSKRLQGDHQTSLASTPKISNLSQEEKLQKKKQQQQKENNDEPLPTMDSHVVIAKASRCNRVCLTPQPNNNKVAENENEAKGKAVESYSCDEIGQTIKLRTDEPVLWPELNDRTIIHDIELDLPSFNSDLLAFINGESGKGSNSNNPDEPLQSWDQLVLFPHEDWTGIHVIEPDFLSFNSDLFVSDNGEAGQGSDSNNHGSLPFWDQPAFLWPEENILRESWIGSQSIEPGLSCPSLLDQVKSWLEE